MVENGIIVLVGEYVLSTLYPEYACYGCFSVEHVNYIFLLLVTLSAQVRFSVYPLSFLSELFTFFTSLDPLISTKLSTNHPSVKENQVWIKQM
jgi:hypothetical protein